MRSAPPVSHLTARWVQQRIYLPVFTDQEVARYVDYFAATLAVPPTSSCRVRGDHLARYLLEVAFELYRAPVATLGCLPPERQRHRRLCLVVLPLLPARQAAANRRTIDARHRRWPIDRVAIGRLGAAALLIAVGQLATRGRLVLTPRAPGRPHP